MLYLLDGLILLALWNVPLISVNIFFKSTLSDISIATLALLWLWFAWYFPSFYFWAICIFESMMHLLQTAKNWILFFHPICQFLSFIRFLTHLHLMLLLIYLDLHLSYFVFLFFIYLMSFPLFTSFTDGFWIISNLIYTNLIPVRYRNIILIYIHSYSFLCVCYYCYTCYICMCYKFKSAVKIIILYNFMYLKQLRERKQIYIYRVCYINILI